MRAGLTGAGFFAWAGAGLRLEGAGLADVFLAGLEGDAFFVFGFGLAMGRFGEG